MSYYAHLKHSLRWNAIESIIYYSIFVAHQFLLRSTMDSLSYGAVSSLFAMLYLTIIVVNFGFDFSIAPFFSFFKKSQKTFKQFLLKQLLLQIIIYSITGILAFIVLSKGLIPIKTMPSIAWQLSCIISLLVVTESLKKSFRIILQLAFSSHITATIELFYIISYVTIVWGSFILTGVMSFYTVFIPMLILSTSSMCMLGWAVYKYYKTLPKQNEQPYNLSWNQFLKNRISNYGYQLSKTFLTSNFLIPFFAVTYGLSIAALLELVTATTQFFSVIIQKIFGISGQAVFAHAKHKTTEFKKDLFESTTQKLYPLLYSMVFFAIVAYKPLMAFKVSTVSQNEYSIALLFFLVLFSENFVLMYEKWFIIEEKTNYLIAVHVTLLTVFFAITRLFSLNSAITVLILLLITRGCMFFAIRYCTYRLWKNY